MFMLSRYDTVDSSISTFILIGEVNTELADIFYTKSYKQVG
jgi:hypothetical protein